MFWRLQMICPLFLQSARKIYVYNDWSSFDPSHKMRKCNDKSDLDESASWYFWNWKIEMKRMIKRQSNITIVEGDIWRMISKKCWSYLVLQDNGFSKYIVSTQDHYICNWFLIKVFFFCVCFLFMQALEWPIAFAYSTLQHGTPFISYLILGQVTKCDPVSMSNNKLFSWSFKFAGYGLKANYQFGWTKVCYIFSKCIGMLNM